MKIIGFGIITICLLTGCSGISYQDQLTTAIELQSIYDRNVARQYISNQLNSHRLTYDEYLSLDDAINSIEQIKRSYKK